jgi:putative endonuclease
MRELRPAVYIVANCRNGTLYIGVTSNLPGRISQHRTGSIPGFSKRYGCTILVWFEACDTMDQAIVREKQIKEWQRGWKLKLIEAENPEWEDLFATLF